MKKLDYIDGLKGMGALMVYLCHFVFAFYYAAYTLLAEHVNTRTGVEILIGKTPLNFFYITTVTGRSASSWCSAALCCACLIFVQGTEPG